MAIAASKIERIVGSWLKTKDFAGGREPGPIWHSSLSKIDHFQTNWPMAACGRFADNRTATACQNEAIEVVKCR